MQPVPDQLTGAKRRAWEFAIVDALLNDDYDLRRLYNESAEFHTTVDAMARAGTHLIESARRSAVEAELAKRAALDYYKRAPISTEMLTKEQIDEIMR